MLERAREVFASAPAEVELALDELQAVVERLRTRYPSLNLYLDLCELEGYHYHTGIVFAAYCKRARRALGNGGRYDDIGESFGRARPATGFSVDLKEVAAMIVDLPADAPGIYADPVDDPALQNRIGELRARGERVVCGFEGQQPDFRELRCDRRLVAVDGEWQIQPIESSD